MSQTVVLKPTLSQPVFPLNIRSVDKIFPGFAYGDFALIQGTSVLSLSSLLCVQAQLPTQFGGLKSNVIFIEGGYTFRLYQIAQLAKLHQLDPRKVLDNIYISRAFTAYQATSLIIEQLKDAIKKYDAKLVIISDIAGFFLDTDIVEYEAERIYSQICTYLSNLARETKTIILTTYPQHGNTARNRFFQTVTCNKANVVLTLRKTSYARQFILEKHPYLATNMAELPTENLTLTDFM
jgi:hypothetical protein